MATIVEPITPQETTATTGTSTPPVTRTRMPSQRTLAIVFGVVAVLALAAWMLVTSGQRKEEFANRALLQARSMAEQGNLPLAATEFQKIIDTYRGTDAARDALLSLNQVRLINGQAELAAVSLREFIASDPAPEYAAPAHGMLAAALENAGRSADAAASYRQASALAPVGYLKAEYLVDAGRAYLNAGMPAEAEQAYRTVVEDYATAAGVTEAKVRLAELTAGRPPETSAP